MAYTWRCSSAAPTSRSRSNGRRLTVAALADGYRAAIKVGVGDLVRELHGGDSVEFLVGRRSPTGEQPILRPGARHRFDGAIFDIDGVLVDSPHELAWRETLRELIETSWAHIRPQTTWAPDRFTSHVYQEVVAGKPRMSGARAALRYFGLPDDNELVEEYATRKQQMVVGLIEAGRFTAFPDALRLLLAVRAAGIRVAAASSSKNTGPMLSRVRMDTFADEQGLEIDFIRTGQTVLDLIDVDISGRSFTQGKPHPEIFLTASRELGVAPESCFVVEDAVSGITAAKAGGMAALGIARADDSQLLSEAGADLVVTTLDDVNRDALLQRRLIGCGRPSLLARAHASGGRPRRAQTRPDRVPLPRVGSIVPQFRSAADLGPEIRGHAVRSAPNHDRRDRNASPADADQGCRVTGTSSPTPLPNGSSAPITIGSETAVGSCVAWRPRRSRQAPAPRRAPLRRPAAQAHQHKVLRSAM